MRNLRDKTQSDAPGEDSFLDVVANLVGILIILVMVIGAQAHFKWQQSAKRNSVTKVELEQSKTESESMRAQADSMRSENRELELRIKQEELATNMLGAERDAIQLAVLQIERDIEKLESQHSSSQRETLAKQNAVAELELEYQDIQRAIELTKQTATESVEQIEHKPSPIAKTVFGEEIHFRLNKGRIALVPMMDLVGLVKVEIERKGRALQAGKRTVSTVGPVDGFRMQYELAALEITRKSDQMLVRQKAAQVEEFILLPIRDDLGETLSDAMTDRSQFMRKIDQADPGKTTISIWTYPDSYAEFRQLRQFLTERGFMTAAWPLPAGQPISGSPNGYHSAAQ